MTGPKTGKETIAGTENEKMRETVLGIIKSMVREVNKRKEIQK